MSPAALSLLWTILALIPTPHLRESLKALLFLFLTGHGKARPQHSKTKSPSALSRFLNRYPWPTRALIRLVREETQEALDRARVCVATLKRKGPKPRLLVVLDLVTLEKRGRFPHLPLSFFHGKWGLHLVVLYLVCGDLRIPWAYRLKMFPWRGSRWRGKGEKALSLLSLSLLASLPAWMRRTFRIRVAADAAFGTAWFLFGVRRLGLETVGGPGLPLGAFLPGLGGLVPLSSAPRGLGVAVRGGHLSRHAPDHAHLGKEAVHGRALLPGYEERVLPGAVRAADGFEGAPLSGALPSGLPAGVLGADGEGGRGAYLAGSGGVGGSSFAARAGGPGGSSGAPCLGPGAPG